MGYIGVCGPKIMVFSRFGHKWGVDFSQSGHKFGFSAIVLN